MAVPAEVEIEQSIDFDEQDRIALAEKWEPIVTAGGSLLDVDTESAIEWVPGAEGIIRRAERQSWVANYGQGKTQALSHLIVQVCEAGGRVIHVDVENDRREMAERIKPIAEAWGVDIRGRHAYHDSIDVLRSGEFLAALPVADLLVIDSLSRVLAALGYDENSNPDVIGFMTNIVDVVAKQVGVAVLILDNTGKSGRDARGAVSKAAAVEAVYEVSGGAKVSEAEHGTLKLKRMRSRSGKLPQLIAAGSGGGEWERLTAQEGDSSRDDKVEGRRLLVKQLLYEHRDQEFTADQVAAAVGSHPKTVGRDLSAMESDGTITVRKQGNTRLWSAVSQ